jgi:hypothetical protein
MKIFWTILASVGLAVRLLAQDGDAREQRRNKIDAQAREDANGFAPKDQQSCPVTPITCPFNGSGSLDTSSCVHVYLNTALNSYMDLYSLEATVGQTIAAQMDSASFPTYLTLRDSTGKTIAFDTPGSGNSVSLTYTVSTPGTYTIAAESDNPIASTGPHKGLYLLTVVGCQGSTGGGGGGGIDNGTCGSTTAACLTGDRFKVSVSFTANGTSADATAIRMTTDTGYFWFFDPTNVELVVKVLDGRSINNHFWVFYGALSNTQYTITVVDTVTGQIRHYTNPAGQQASVGDTAAF